MPDTLQLPRIKRLSSSLANQIAAGEVIERPASVLKELLENSLDAGATRIVVDISKAGSENIRVTDNGHGIHPDDLELALHRHATAKLNKQSDLAAIRSLGFLGEAFTSIASVSSFTITSRIADRAQATRLMIDPETGTSELGPAAHPTGTTMEVRNLFHNTPARKKFLRSERTEFLHIQETARRLAMSRFSFDLELGHNGRKVFGCRAVATDLQTRVASILGKTFIKKAIFLEHEVGNMRVWGWLGTCDQARSTTDRQYLYLNGRMIYDKRLNHAIRAAYEGHLAAGRYPSFLIYLEMDVRAADVNVHPTKHEVRFRQARDVHDFIYAGLSSSLKNHQDLYPADSISFDKMKESVADSTGGSAYPGRQSIVGVSQAGYRRLYSAHQTELGSNVPSLGQVLVQINQDFLLAQRGADLLLLNITAAKKHIAQTRMESVKSGEAMSGRPLLVPVSYEINQARETNLALLSPILEEYALQLEMSGPGVCRLRTIAHLLENADLTSLVNDILDLQIDDKSAVEIRQHLIKTLVKHVCDIPEPSMSDADMVGLLRQLEINGVDVRLKRYPPVWAYLDPGELEKLTGPDEG